jgi:hypothetical protein
VFAPAEGENMDVTHRKPLADVERGQGARRYDDAIAESRRILERHPETRLAYNVIGHCYAKKTMYQEAEAAFREYQPKIPPSASPWIAYVLALAGKAKKPKQ